MVVSKSNYFYNINLNAKTKVFKFFFIKGKISVCLIFKSILKNKFIVLDKNPKLLTDSKQLSSIVRKKYITILRFLR